MQLVSFVRNVSSSATRGSKRFAVMSSPFLQVLALSAAAADKAGNVIRDIMASGKLEVVEKTGKNDLQTLADRTANDIICGSLKNAFPDLAVIGEEGDVDVSRLKSTSLLVDEKNAAVLAAYEGKLADDVCKATWDDLTVWVDPLDGTKEYTEGYLDHVTVLVGVAVGKKAVGGVIHQPFWNYDDKTAPDQLGRTFYGVVGAGTAGSIARKSTPANERIVTTTRSHSTGLVADVVQACEPTKVIKAGGSGHKVINLIEGKAHAYVFSSPGCKKWDTCAPEAILHAVGGKLTDIKGDFYEYDKNVGYVDEWGILATAEASDHSDYLEKIPAHLKDRVKDCFKK